MMSEGEATFCAFIAAIIGAIGGAFVAATINNNSWRTQAIEKGYAEYVLKGSEAVWQWKEPKPVTNKEQP